MQTDTIAAIATPPGIGGVGIIRISGPLAHTIAKLVTHKELTAKQVSYVPMFNNHGEKLDEGIALYFVSPHSFTGEDVVELHAHGNHILLNLILKVVIAHGARLAHPGEFSERAFLNHKLDLIQAEAICDLITAQSELAVRNAARSLQGEFSQQVHLLLQELINLRVLVEAEIDFSDEEIPDLAHSVLATRLTELRNRLQTIYQKAQQGHIFQQGLTIVILGKPNAGKSTLLNQLCEKEIAIVSDIAGTTRDLVHDYLSLDGIPVKIIDTAGIQTTQDPIEQEGIRRAKEALLQADILLWVRDVREKDTLAEFLDTELQAAAAKKILIVHNKIDLLPERPLHVHEHEVFVSAKFHQGLEQLKALLKTMVGLENQSENVFSARTRHLVALEQIQAHALSAQQLLFAQQGMELVAEELRLAQVQINTITGEFTSDDLLGEIFSSFCIGK